MAFWFQCPSCQSKRMATEDIIGRRVRCADCHQIVEVSRSESETPVDQAEMDRASNELITEESVVSDAEFESQNTGQSAKQAKKKRFRGGKKKASPVGDTDGSDDSDAAETMDAKPLIRARVNPAEDGDEHFQSGEFALAPPSEDIDELSGATTGDEALVEVVGIDDEHAGTVAAKAKKNLEWKTVPDEGDPDYVDPPLIVKKEREASEMDMTPMVDVTFLLLIFFMVTASFVVQKSLNRPTVPPPEPSTNTTDEEEDAEDMVEVNIASDNTYYVVLPEEEPIEAPSEQDLRIALAHAKDGGSSGIEVEKMLIRAHEDSYHGRVIVAMDIGADMGFDLQVQITTEDY